ncbi:hypothetical protein CARUB_v10019446mg [Capsella rubella]|uniref:Stomatal closure-related actin-binding protein coiled-coil domain-containing protein n=1 Tax=Capsella rubella TaxID=81985 RepID=R0HQ28_9BRAS|nr:hypothetical protein CARUB_v10019446mg [Capsella rubella]
MTKVCPEIEDRRTLSKSAVPLSDHFPTYKLEPDNQIVEEPKEDDKCPSVKETVEKESELLSDQHKRLSVRNLASKFEKNLASAVSLADEAKLREVASLEGHVMLKKLMDALECRRGRTDGKNKEDVEALAVKLTQNEGKLIQEKFEVKKLGNFLKETSEDAKKLVNQENSFACAEIETATAVVLKLGEAFEEQERISEASRAQGPVIGMQQELHGLRNRIQEKYMNYVNLYKERAEESKSCPFVLEGTQSLGSCLKVRVNAPDNSPDLSNCSIQWYRAACETSRREAISDICSYLFASSFGAIQSIYAPEPFDVGRILQADILSNGRKFTVTTDDPETLMRKSNSEFIVVISQMNGQDYASRSHIFTIGKTRIKLSRGWISKAREIYSTSMQLCGVRSNIKTPTKALFWQPRKSLSFILTFESEQERNAAIVLARKYAFDCNVARRLVIIS